MAEDKDRQRLMSLFGSVLDETSPMHRPSALKDGAYQATYAASNARESYPLNFESRGVTSKNVTGTVIWFAVGGALILALLVAVLILLYHRRPLDNRRNESQDEPQPGIAEWNEEDEELTSITDRMREDAVGPPEGFHDTEQTRPPPAADISRGLPNAAPLRPNLHVSTEDQRKRTSDVGREEMQHDPLFQEIM